jgi:hypothetical protein
MNAYKVDAIVTENGLAISSGLPLPVGSSVEVIILDNATIVGEATRNENHKPSTNDVSANNRDYLVSISSLMTEWESAADESAYQDL